MKCTIIGPVSPPNSGPGLKNEILIEELNKLDVNLDVINTLNYKKNLLGTLLKLVFNKNNQVILATSKNGRNILIPYLYLRRLINKKFKYLLIPMGGNLPDEIKKKRKMSKFLFLKGLEASDLILVESNELKNKLSNSLNLKNIDYFPNFKRRIEFDFSTIKNFENSNELKCIFLSSVKKSKGVEMPLEALNSLKEKYNLKVKYDIYGPFREGYKEELEQVLKKYDFAQYMGMADSKRVSKIIAEYDIFLFPTFYEGEGFPAVIIDAMISETPIICSDNNYNEEIIKNGVNGYIFKSKDTEDLKEKIETFIQFPKKIKDISINNKSEKEKYYSDVLIKKLLKIVKDELGWK